MPDTPAAQEQKGARVPRRGRWRRRLVRAAIVCLVLFVAAELVARYALGLGDPVLYVEDPQVEYLQKPSMSYRRIGGRHVVNAYAMRSEEFPARKADPRELRVMVLGDSVVCGTSPVGQQALCTTVLERRLREALGRPVVVGNISAGSWGPGNLLAYARKFGLFNADVVLIVANSHDADDVMTFAPNVGVDPNMPAKRPLLALQEAVTRYLPRYLPFRRAPPQQPLATSEQGAALPELRALVQLAKSSGARVAILQPAESPELAAGFRPGHAMIARVAAEEGIPTFQLGPMLKQSLDAGKNPYLDNIHLNAAGHAVLAEGLYRLFEQVNAPAPKP